MKAARLFIFSAAILLLATAAAKLISSFGAARVLETREPLFQVSYRSLFWIVGTLELGISLFFFFGKCVAIQIGLVAWLATIFLLYHASMPWVGWHRPCPCLGNLTDALHISPQTADVAMKIILAYLLIGSYTSLFWLWWQQRKNNQPAYLTHQQP